MKKIIFFITLIAVLVFGASISTLAQDSTTADTAEVTAQDLEISEQTLLPDSLFYFLKEWRRGIQSFFAFGRLKKTEIEQRFANERLIELKKLVEEGKASSEILEKATEKYNRTMEKIKERAEKIRENAEQNENVNKFLEKFTNQQVLHERILQKLEEKVPEDVLEKIREAREQHLERFREVMQKLGSNKERIAERLQNALQNGDQDNLEILNRIREKMPEEVQEKLNEAREKVVEKIIEKLTEENKKKNCRALTTPWPNCLSGKLIIERDASDCPTKVYCAPLRACTLEYAPVCGVNSITYNNKCFAEIAGVEVEKERECDAVQNSFKTCDSSSSFRCQYVTQGAKPTEDTPFVCGCIPKCEPGGWVFANLADGKWPDGSNKGEFRCAAGDPPPQF